MEDEKQFTAKNDLLTQDPCLSVNDGKKKKGGLVFF